MAGARSLIAALHELNRSEDKTVAHFTPSLIGMFGSISIFDSFLTEVDTALAAGSASPSLKKRAANLVDTFIPQIADYNDIENPSAVPATADDLRAAAADSLDRRRKGICTILSALIAILKEVEAID